MKLRARLALTVLAMSLPVALGLTFAMQSWRERALLESVYESTLARMEDGGRERCEAAPDRLDRAERRGRRMHARRVARRIARERRVYDESFRPIAPGVPPIEPDLREAIEDGDAVAASWLDGRRRVRIAMRMPWDGPCAIVVIERGSGPLFEKGAFFRLAIWTAIVTLLSALAALLAMGPIALRMRRLASAVRANASRNYASDVEVRGADEIADLARAFNDASTEIRKRLDEVSARDKALTEFLASTTHDVMVPLTVLLGHLSDLKSDVKKGAVDPARVGAALEEAHYLGALLRNLSAAARLDAGEPMMQRHRFDLRALIERVIARHRPIAEERQIELAHAVPENEVEVVADSTLLEQAVSNLVHNALRYNRAGGHVAVVLEQGPRTFEVRVMDDGPGIPKEELARIGERRFRGGAARKRHPTGLGLGLHIVRDVAERHGFALRFEAREEGGLTVALEGASI